MTFPARRLRRLRTSAKMRELVQETTLNPSNLICPVFVQEDLKSRIKVESMSEIERIPLDDINDEVGTISDLNIPAIMLFGIPTKKMMQELLPLMKMELYKKQFLKSDQILEKRL